MDETIFLVDETICFVDETIFSVDETMFLVDETVCFVDETMFFVDDILSSVDEKRAKITAGYHRGEEFFLMPSLMKSERLQAAERFGFLKSPVRFCTLSVLGGQNSTVECAIQIYTSKLFGRSLL
jgi:hypothetical protein